MHCLTGLLRPLKWFTKSFHRQNGDIKPLSDDDHGVEARPNSGSPLQKPQLRPPSISSVADNVRLSRASRGSEVKIDGPSTNPSRLFALLIGIDEYLELPQLRGAVNDAKAMENFLQSIVGVPSERIRLLLNSAASRECIIGSLLELSLEEKVSHDDPILIYFAGHGTQMSPLPGWEAGGTNRKIQGILPCDYREGVVCPIPDRTIGALIDLICQRKGNNITAILDCCHSASGTRTDQPFTEIRGVSLCDDTFPVDLDQDVLSLAHERGARQITTFGLRGLRSHVLLAACKEAEFAKESEGRGRFTVALLDVFQKEYEAGILTYSDVLKYMKPIPDQNPQVEGIHRDRIIFTTQQANKQQMIYSIRPDKHMASYVLEAGSAHGIADGSKFTIYTDLDALLQSCPSMTLTVEKVSAFNSILHTPEGSFDPLLGPGIAIQSAGSKEQALPIKVIFDQETHHVKEALQKLEQGNVIAKVGEDHNALVEMQLQNEDLLIFSNLHPTVQACGLRHIHHTLTLSTTPVSVIVDTLLAASRFFWNLNRGHPHPLVNAITIEFFELTKSNDKYDAAGRPELIPSEKNLLQHGSIDLFVSPNRDTGFGIKITNLSDWDLFPVAFYFDHSDWSVETYYHPGTAGPFVAESPLHKQGGTLTIGYGSGDSQPIGFEINSEKADIDVGHLKVIFSTKPVDLQRIGQKSPFKVNSDEDRATYRLPPVDLATWAAVQYPIIQRRYPHMNSD